MKFFLNVYNSICIYPSIKFIQNLFFIKNMSSINFTHNLYPYFFLNTKILKIKWLKSNNYINLHNYLYWYISITFLIVIIYFIV